MISVNGIALPAAERHFVESPGLGCRYAALDAALKYLPVQRRRMAVDIGAHVGLWSRWLVKEFAIVHAFEPVGEYADLLRKNVPESNVILHRCAIGEHFGRVAIKKYPQNTGQAHISGPGVIPRWRFDCFKLGEVDLIKIDVEGYELPVVKGAIATLRLCRPIVVIEQRGCEIVNFGATVRDQALTYLESIGMRRLENVGHDWIMGWE